MVAPLIGTHDEQCMKGSYNQMSKYLWWTMIIIRERVEKFKCVQTLKSVRIQITKRLKCDLTHWNKTIPVLCQLASKHRQMAVDTTFLGIQYMRKQKSRVFFATLRPGNMAKNYEENRVRQSAISQVMQIPWVLTVPPLPTAFLWVAFGIPYMNFT